MKASISMDHVTAIESAYEAQFKYINGQIDRHEFIRKANPFIECGSPFDEHGDYVCTHCVRQYIEEHVTFS